MNENKILEELKKQTEDIKVPESLEPENIMNTIKNKKSNVVSFTGRKAKTITGLVSAAAVLLVAGVAYSHFSITPQNSTVISTENGIVTEVGNVTSYEEVYKKLEKIKKEYEKNEDGLNFFGSVDGAMIESATVTETMTNVNSAMGVTGGEAGFSKTNVQTEGIDEADIIKTDGKYIYHLSSDLHAIRIYSVNGAETLDVAKIAVADIGTIDEMYVEGNELIVTGISFRDEKYQLTLVKYDITDRSNPKEAGTYVQEGRSLETRKIEDIIYVASQIYVDLDKIDEKKPETYIPSCENVLYGLDKIIIPDEVDCEDYLIFSSVDTKTMKMIDTTAVLGFNGDFYMGTENVYLYRTINDSEIMTELRKLSYSDGEIGALVESKVPGKISDTFAINEYNGYLRVMTTSYPEYSKNESVNNVFVLDGSMKIVGSIEGLAKGERIYSARYMGDIAYFVTYRETDPLFSVDLSNPEKPVLMGELKIPGFSEYLHPYGEGKLLGIGVQMENNYFWAQDIKLSMFDISDPYNVTEESVTILENANDTLALSEYKAVMIDAEKNIFGFLTMDYSNETGSAYRVFRYENEKFVEIINHKVSEDVNRYGVRSVYIGDYVYVVDEKGVTAYSIQ